MLFFKRILFVKRDASRQFLLEIPRFNRQIDCFFGRVVNPSEFDKVISKNDGIGKVFRYLNKNANILSTLSKLT